MLLVSSFLEVSLLVVLVKVQLLVSIGVMVPMDLILPEWLPSR